MSTMKRRVRRAILSGMVGAALAAGTVGTARADVASDSPGAILIFPKIIVDTAGIFGPPTDTEIQLVNTSDSVISARCFLVNTTSHCNNDPSVACTPDGEANGPRRCPAGGRCVANWGPPNDFRMTLTKRQPISWVASDGLASFPCDPTTGSPGSRACAFGSNAGSSIPGVAEDPFFGELKCIEVDPGNFTPTIGFNPANNAGGDLMGEATIVAATPEGSAAPDPRVDARKYNALAIQAIAANGNNGDDTLTIGGPGAEYNGCPNVLILNHMFDGAPVVTHRSPTVSATVTTDLTVIPCGEDFRNPANLGGATLQFLIYNEFEQRFSTSTHFTCWREVQLSDIDTNPGNVGGNDSFSIFNVNVQGTLSGQTRIRPVAGSSVGNTILGIAEQFWAQDTGGTGPGGVSTSATNLHFTGTRDLGDQLILDPQ